MNTEATSSPSAKVYRPVGLWRMMPLSILAFCVTFSIMFIILMYAPKIDFATRIIYVIGALFMLLLGSLLSFGFRRIRLVTSPQGVTYYGVGFRAYTPWDNIKGIGEGVYEGNQAIGGFYQPDRQVEGLLLRNPAVVGYKLNDGIQQHIPIIEASVLLRVMNMSRFAGVIPTATFFNDTTLQDFLTDARQYAPKVFDTKPRFDITPLF